MREILVALCALLFACRSSSSFDGIARAEATGGPTVRFDLAQKSFPEMPFPNDVATRPDPQSPTGLRVNAALVAPTSLETRLRAQLDRLDGFGTYAPITVAFDGDLDVLDLYARQNDADPANDAVLLIDLADGKLWPLDLGGGHFPYELPAPSPYFLGDPLAAATNLLFPVDLAAPAGPNFLHPPDPGWATVHGGVPQASDDLLGFYERSTHTLVLRPVLPLPQQHRFAVVLTKRLIGANGKAVTSPFPAVNHALQTGQLSALPALLPAGTRLSDVAFTWAFTTQSVTRDLEAIRAGLDGTGPLAGLSQQFPAVIPAQSLLGGTFLLSRLAISRVVDAPAAGENPFLLSSARFRALLQDPALSGFFTGFTGDAAELQMLTDTFRYVDYLVFGSFVSPDLLADPDLPPGDATFVVDLPRRAARSANAVVPFVLAVPKAQPAQALAAARRPPFPVALVGHGYRSSRFEGIVSFAGTFAKFGIASVAIDAWGHGLGLPAQAAPGVLSEQLVQDLLQARGVGALAAAVLATRARDLDGDGVRDPGGDLWTANAFHTRDVLRQSVVDWMQLTRLLRTFDGRSIMVTPPLAPTVPGSSGQTLIAGDFNGDGVPDVGGPAAFAADVKDASGSLIYSKGAPDPGSATFAFGVSLGGILSGILPAVEPSIVAAAPVSAGGGLADVLLRGGEKSARDEIYLEAFGPILGTCSFSTQAGACGGPGGVPALVWEVANANREVQVPIAPLSLRPGDILTACDLAQAQGPLPPDAQLAAAPPAGCWSAAAVAGTGGGADVHLSLAADGPQLFTHTDSPDAGTPPTVSVLVVQPGDPLHVVVTSAGGGTRAIDSFAFDAAFAGVRYPAGTPLQAIARGYGAGRNTPAFRRLWVLWQTALEPGDPINYAGSWFQNPLPARGGGPATVALVATSGDPIVPIGSGLALARAAGLVEMGQVDPAYGVTDDRLLVLSGVADGVARLGRYSSTAPGTPRALLGSSVTCDPAPACDVSTPVLLDTSSLYCGAGGTCADGLGCDAAGGNCTARLAAPRLNPPLRDQLTRALRSADGTPVGTAALVLPYLNRAGQNGFRYPQPHKQFDTDLFLANLIGRYFETRGQELRFDACQAQPAACAWILPPPP